MGNSAVKRALSSFSVMIAFAAIASALPACAPKQDDVEQIPARRAGDESDAAGSDTSNLDGTDGLVDADPRAAEMNSRADRALETLMLRFWRHIREDKNLHYWTYAQHWDVVLDGAERLGPSAYRGTARMFFELQNSRGWIRDHYDDENWMVLTLIHAYDRTLEEVYLAKARELFADVMNGWDDTCCGASKGGIWWRKAKDGKNNAVNAGAVVSASRLFERTKEPSYLAFAKKAYEFWSKNMVDQQSGHVFDNVTSSGVIDKERSLTYNEGMMIGAAVALAKAEGNGSRLELAHKIAGYMMANEVASTSIGTILSDGNCGSKAGDGNEQFKGVSARYLAELYLADRSHTEYREFLVRSAEALWTLARDPASGLFTCNWEGPYNPEISSVHSTTSAAAALAAAARILGPAAKRPALEYEGEEANLHGVGLEANYAGFEGWGYAAGWGADGTSLDFVVDAPAEGTYDVELRYASSAAASRRVSVNGKMTTAKLEFPVTGDYKIYRTVTTAVTLTAGSNVVTFAFDTASASAGFINLDRARFIPK